MTDPTTMDDADRTIPDNQVALLVDGARNGVAIRRMLDEIAIDHAMLDDVDSLVARIEAGCGPVVTTAESLGRQVESVVDVLAGQPSWSDVPVILFTSQNARLPVRFASLTHRSNTTVLRRPIQTTTFVTIVRSALADRERQYAVRELLAHLERLNDRNERRIHQLQRLSFQLSRAEEHERRRLASLLHDELQQILVGAQFRLNALERRAGDGRSIDNPTRELRQQLSEAIDRTRHLSHELSPPALRSQTLFEAIEWLGGQMKSSYGLEVTVAGAIDRRLDPEDLETFAYRAVQELLFNVVKHAATEHAWVDIAGSEGSMTITVRDEGAGFSPEALEDAQGPLEGGLGLFGIQERARILGGDLEIASAPDQGSRCELSLPLRSRAEPPSASRGDGDGRQGNGIVRVVIVDDHHYLREGVKTLLAEEADLEVVGEAADGRRALDVINECRPDVVLLDIAMPVMDGLETARRLRERHPDLRIIGLSTFAHDEMGERMRRAGADTYVCKSDAGERLVAAVRGIDR
ncbi:response regulator [bacterium]|nr:response regulator [bacterium]